MADGYARKRRKVATSEMETEVAATPSGNPRGTSNNGVYRPISPPMLRGRGRSRASSPSPSGAESGLGADAGPHVIKQTLTHPPPTQTRTATPKSVRVPRRGEEDDEERKHYMRYLRSPIQLTRISGLEPAKNVDTLALRDIIGHPLLEECWCFNFLFDIEFLLQHFDPDIRTLVKLNIIHGFWKKEDQSRIALLEAASRHDNVALVPAYMPDPFGTHHSKMMILLRRDGFAQVVIHTANMISRDWGNMTQGVWRSPLLPLKEKTDALVPSSSNGQEDEAYPIGSGERFKVDLLRYLRAYGKRLGGLMKHLVEYDFSSIRAAFLGSAPSRQKPDAARPDIQTSFGWKGLKEILSTIPIKQSSKDQGRKANIVVQVSSIATLGANPTWLEHFQSVLSSHSIATSPPTARQPSRPTIFTKPSSLTRPSNATSTFNIIFPTPSEIRASLDGYGSGSSIHTKIQSTAQQKQLEYVHPLFCHWASTTSLPTPAYSSSSATNTGEAHRGLAAPHIKTYIRFSNQSRKTIDWAMLTSANLSKQAWGEVVNKKDEVWIQSWECGVVVWPALFDGEGEAVMVPVFGRDAPMDKDVDQHEDAGMKEDEIVDEEKDPDETEDENEDEVIDPDETEDEIDPDETEDEIDPDEMKDKAGQDIVVQARKKKTKIANVPEAAPKLEPKPVVGKKGKKTVVGFRMPYNLPLTPYALDEVPWCATLTHAEPDRMGRFWPA
ncbi:phospholipase D/nuclease [Byssothecium circinans]|uniref:Phospholipase D/nuclease n=1 Tax=Byssothecium circinans TaxID=147558 RepID=A0A6A5TAZ4_9PLEO|nr:phospholipase D/nuclease [Byssothecium circinans]